MKVFDDKYKFNNPRIQPRMQLRSEICKHFESWSADSPRRVKDLFTVLRETSPSADEQQPTKAPSPPPMDWTRKPLKK